MTGLNASAKAALRDAGFTQAEWARMHSSPDGKWHGDQCGCPDDRCANGFHHMGTDDCGCLPTLLGDAVAWREATHYPNNVILAAPYGLYRWVTVSTPGVLATVSATAGSPGPEESVVRIEARAGWTATVGEENGHMVVRFVKTSGKDTDGG